MLSDATPLDSDDCRKLFRLLDGLPLVLAQASAFMRETGTTVSEYIQFYEDQWSELMQPADESVPLQDYPNGSVCTTWNISYKSIEKKDELAARLLLLWAHLDNKDLWFELFEPALKFCQYAECVPKWFQQIASSKLKFKKTMKVLLDYSLVESTLSSSTYVTHPVVHTWALQTQSKETRTGLGWLATVIAGLAAPSQLDEDFGILQRRLLPHVQCCSRQVLESMGREDVSKTERGIARVVDVAYHCLGDIYADYGNFVEAEKMYKRALEGTKRILGPNDSQIPFSVNELGKPFSFIRKRGNSTDTEQSHQIAVESLEKPLSLGHLVSLGTMKSLGNIYLKNGKLDEAEKMYQRALEGYVTVLGQGHRVTLITLKKLSNLFRKQGKAAEAELMYKIALEGLERAHGPEHTLTRHTVCTLSILYATQNEYRKQPNGRKLLDNLQSLIVSGETAQDLIVTQGLMVQSWLAKKLNRTLIEHSGVPTLVRLRPRRS
jgi:tetratricopeptide (TPR) repeat protein